MIRSSDDISRGLAAPRAARAIEPGVRLHVMGVGGAASAGAALHAAALGAVVTACDAGGPDQLTDAVLEAGIPILWANDAAHIASFGNAAVQRLAVTKAVTSVRPDHPELLAANAYGVEPESVQQVIADAAATGGRRLIGVTGTHGKSTTSGWLLHVLAAAGGDPSGFVGAPLPHGLSGSSSASVARIGTGGDFVVEADEYAGNFDPYRPAIGLLVSAEWDHPDVFADQGAVSATFAAWIVRFEGASSDERPILVANAGDPGVTDVLELLAGWPGERILVRLLGPDDADAAPERDMEARPGIRHIHGRLVGEDGLGAELEIVGLRADPRSRDRVPIRLVGAHMAVDGLMAAAGALAAGVAADDIIAGLATFEGVGRRLELKGDVGGVVVLDDYAHHPTAMRATFAAVRQRYPGRRLWAVYEPLTYHRTAAMLDAFADVLATADRSAIVDIWPVRDPDTTITSAEALAEAVGRRGGPPSMATGSPEVSGLRLAELVEPGDVVLVMGGGRSYVAAERLVDALKARREGRAPQAGTASPS